MWNSLENENKSTYKKLITNFASLSEAFTQKSTSNKTVTPIVNSKFQETVFQKSFNAIGEDIANTSFDASLIIDENCKYLVGIKSFGKESGAQKIAQFKSKSASENWGEIFSQITENAKNSTNKKDADQINEPLYLKLAIKISELRNDRINSHKEQIRGFQGTDTSVNSIYHVLMPSSKDGIPKIHVGEIPYSLIDISNIKILGSTSLRTPNNFAFTDGNHEYRYTSSDSQLLMNFRNEEIIVETWEIDYAENPIEIFENLDKIRISEDEFENKVQQSVSWLIPDKNNEVPQKSGYNAFNAKPKSDKNAREKFIKNIWNDFEISASENQLNNIKLAYNRLFHPENKDFDFTYEREHFMKMIENLNNCELTSKFEKFLYRPDEELYIPIPKSSKFHEKYPDFFGPGFGKTKNGSKKLALPKEKRVFDLEFLASGEIMEAFITQDAGKALQSYKDQQLMGKWIRHKVFQLGKREVLTFERLLEIGINGIRLTKYKDSSKPIGLEFIWIDKNNPPKDFWS